MNKKPLNCLVCPVVVSDLLTCSCYLGYFTILYFFCPWVSILLTEFLIFYKCHRHRAKEFFCFPSYQLNQSKKSKQKLGNRGKNVAAPTLRRKKRYFTHWSRKISPIWKCRSLHNNIPSLSNDITSILWHFTVWVKGHKSWLKKKKWRGRKRGQRGFLFPFSLWGSPWYRLTLICLLVLQVHPLRAHTSQLWVVATGKIYLHCRCTGAPNSDTFTSQLSGTEAGLHQEDNISHDPSSWTLEAVLSENIVQLQLISSDEASFVFVFAFYLSYSFNRAKLTVSSTQSWLRKVIISLLLVETVWAQGPAWFNSSSHC